MKKVHEQCYVGSLVPSPIDPLHVTTKQPPSGRQNKSFPLLGAEIDCFVLQVELHSNELQGVYSNINFVKSFLQGKTFSIDAEIILDNIYNAMIVHLW